MQSNSRSIAGTPTTSGTSRRTPRTRRCTAFLRTCLQPSRNTGAVRGDVAAFPDIRGDDLPALRPGGKDRRALEPDGRGGPDDSAGANAGPGLVDCTRRLGKELTERPLGGCGEGLGDPNSTSAVSRRRPAASALTW